MSFDSAISIGGRSFVDGFWRMLGPSLSALRVPLPTIIPGVANGLLRVQSITPTITAEKNRPKVPRPRNQPEAPLWLKANLQIDVTGEVQLATEIVAGALQFSPALPPVVSSVDLSNVGATLDVQAGQLPATAPVKIPIAFPNAGSVDLSALRGTGLPVPAVVPVAISLTGDRTLSVELSLHVDVGPGPLTHANSALELCVLDVNVQIDPLGTEINAIESELASQLNALIGQLLGEAVNSGIIQTPSVVQPADVAGIASALGTQVVNGAVNTLTDAFSNLIARTGKLLYPLADGSVSCFAAALPNTATARLLLKWTQGDLGIPYVQIAFSRTSTPPTSFPAFDPQTMLDVQIDIDPEFVLALLFCLLENHPGIIFPDDAVGNLSIQSGGGTTSATVAGCLVCLGLVTLQGDLTIAIEGQPGQPKTVNLSLSLKQTTRAQNLKVLSIEVDVGFDLKLSISPTSSILVVAQNLVDSASVQAKVDTDVKWLVSALTGSVNLFVGGASYSLFEMADALIADSVDGTARAVFNQLKFLSTPVTIPPGVFEAFGSFVPATVALDDLTGIGTLNTPTVPWALLPTTIPLTLPVGVPIGVVRPISTSSSPARSKVRRGSASGRRKRSGQGQTNPSESEIL